MLFGGITDNSHPFSLFSSLYSDTRGGGGGGRRRGGGGRGGGGRGGGVNIDIRREGKVRREKQ